MNGKVINVISTDLSRGGIFTAAAASPITSLSSNLDAAQLSVQEHSGTAKASAGSSFPSPTCTIDITRNGYTPLGIVSVKSSYMGFAFRRYLRSGNEARITLYRDVQGISSTITATITVGVLYMKN